MGMDFRTVDVGFWFGAYCIRLARKTAKGLGLASRAEPGCKTGLVCVAAGFKVRAGV